MLSKLTLLPILLTIAVVSPAAAQVFDNPYPLGSPQWLKFKNEMQRRNAPQQQIQDQQHTELFNSLVQERVLDLNGKQLTCPELAQLLSNINPVSRSFNGQPLIAFDPDAIDRTVVAATACAERAAPLPDSSVKYQNMDLSSRGPQLRNLLLTARERAPDLKVAYTGEIEAQQLQRVQEAQKAEQAQRDADTARRIFEADAVDWKSNYEQVKTVPWISTMEAPQQDEGSEISIRRESAINSARLVVGTQAWRGLTANYLDIRDFPLMLDIGPMADHTLGSLMACIQLTLASDKTLVNSGTVSYSPAILGKYGRSNITVEGTLGPGKKPYKWVMYLKNMGKYFYVDEVQEDGEALKGVPGIIQSAGLLLMACPG